MRKLQDQEIYATPQSSEEALLQLGLESYRLDYSQLMDLLIQLSAVAAIMEKNFDQVGSELRFLKKLEIH